MRHEYGSRVFIDGERNPPSFVIVSVEDPGLPVSIWKKVPELSGVEVEVVPILNDAKLAAIAEPERRNRGRTIGEDIRQPNADRKRQAQKGGNDESQNEQKLYRAANAHNLNTMERTDPRQQ